MVERQWEIIDTLMELLISTVHAINARADRRVTEEMMASFKRVRNKTVLLGKISQASLDRPDGAVREVVFPVARGAQTLREVVAEFRANGLDTPSSDGMGSRPITAGDPADLRHVDVLHASVG